MESRFSHLRQRDNSVSMLRVKMSRRRSQSQKENRQRAVNTRRQLDKLAELEMSSLDASIAVSNMSVLQEKTVNTAKNVAGEERMKQLERWKERKTLEKEKQKREKERKGVFKTGLYHPKGVLTIAPLPPVPGASTRGKEAKVNAVSSQSSRVTRSMRQQQVQKPQTLKKHDSNIVTKKVQPTVERSARNRGAPAKAASVITLPKNKVSVALSTRSANRPPVTAVPVVKDKPKEKCADVRTTRSRAFVNPVAPSSDRERNYSGKSKNTVKSTGHHCIPDSVLESEMHEPEQTPCPAGPTSCSEEENVTVDQAVAEEVDHVVPSSGLDKDPVEVSSSSSSFAPAGFVFHAPTGLSSFKFDPLTPRSADAFLTPSSSFTLPPAPVFNDEQDEPSKPSPPKSPCRSPQHTPPTVGVQPPGSPMESQHDVPYFRSQITTETDRLTSLCIQWESKVEDESIPEEMRDRMRTAVGQAKLLMKERFNQFCGLVDDCEFNRGEKVTTCTDLQGFWDMVYFQVEDVNKKFGALKEAEAQGWVEEQKPPTRQKKVVKKPSAAPVKPTGNKAAARSRLAAVKAAMKAKQQAAELEKANKADGTTEEPSLSSQEPQPQAQSLDTLGFNGGFLQVMSPAKTPGSVRRSSRLSAAVLPQPSPSNHITPRRVTRRSLALAQTPVLQTNASPAPPTLTPAHLCCTLNKTPAQAMGSQLGTPHVPESRSDTGSVSLCFSTVKEDGTEAVSTQDTSVHEMNSPILEQSLPSIAVEDANTPAEDNNAALPLSPCKPPTPVPSASMSFTLSPCGTPPQTPLFSPAVQVLMNVPHSTEDTPECSVNEDMPGLDFERYFQPSQRCSLSPKEMVAIESPSPMEVDVEMENPAGHCEDLHTQQEPALPMVPALLTPQSPQVQTAESALLLFTPDLKDRIRQSVCPSDLMVFTPPKL